MRVNFTLILISFFLGVLILGYYGYIKKLLFKFSRILAEKINFSKGVSLQEKTGIVELIFAASSHVVFLGLIFYIFNLNVISLLEYHSSFLQLLMGIPIGVGIMCVSTTLCSMMVKVVRVCSPASIPAHSRGVATIARSGWVRHHLHVVNNLPLYVALLIILVQLACEEIIFRVVVITVLAPYSVILAMSVSMLLFIYMQTFHMPSKIAALFPVMGACVMAVVHTYLYIKLREIYPLIVSHFAFFLAVAI